MVPTKVRFLQAYGPYKLGQEIIVGRGQTMGGGVATALLTRQVLALVPGEPAETEPRPARARRGS